MIDPLSEKARELADQIDASDQSQLWRGQETDETTEKQAVRRAIVIEAALRDVQRETREERAEWISDLRAFAEGEKETARRNKVHDSYQFYGGYLEAIVRVQSGLATRLQEIQK